MATKTPRSAAKPPEAVEPSFEFGGTVFTWTPWDKDKPPFRFIQVALTYAQFRRYFFIKPYEDRNAEGFQRTQTATQVGKLYKAFRNDEYTPTTFYAGILPHHVQSIVEFERDGVKCCSITVDGMKKLPCTDGGHRDKALTRTLEEAKLAGNQEEVDRILAQPIPMLIHLEPDRLVVNFLNLQKGLVMGQNTERSMRLTNGLIDAESRPILTFVNEVMHKLNADKHSHLHGKVSFVNNDQGVLNYSSIAIESSSNQGCSIYGGGRIAMALEKKPEWLAHTYVEAWTAISQFVEKVETADGEISRVLLPGMPLTQKSLRGGSKGAAAFILGIGNMLAWRKGAMGQEKATDEDLQLIADLADQHFQEPIHGSWSGEDKRRLLGFWARHYFDDIAYTGAGVAPEGKLNCFLGIPRGLLEILSPANFKIGKEDVKLFRQQPLLEDEVTLGGIEEMVNPKRGRSVKQRRAPVAMKS